MLNCFQDLNFNLKKNVAQNFINNYVHVGYLGLTIKPHVN